MSEAIKVGLCYPERLQAIAHELIGTCASIDSVIEDGEDSLRIMADLEAFDLAFLCDRCGWWASTEELHNETEEMLCDECHDEDHDDD